MTAPFHFFFFDADVQGLSTVLGAKNSWASEVAWVSFDFRLLDKNGVSLSQFFSRERLTADGLTRFKTVEKISIADGSDLGTHKLKFVGLEAQNNVLIYAVNSRDLTFASRLQVAIIVHSKFNP